MQAEQLLGGVLVQEGRPIAFTSRKLKSYEGNYATHDLELLAVIHALKVWRHYLLGQRFKLVTDHKSLKWIFTQPNLNMRQRRWIEILHEYDFDIIYRPGKENVVADSLSQKSFVGAISIPDNPIIQKVKDLILPDFEYQQVFRLVQEGGSSEKEKEFIQNYQIGNDCLYYRQQLYVPNDPELRKQILFEGHDSMSTGHPGYVRTLNAIRKSYFWPGMKRDVLRYVKECLSCQRIKAKRVQMPMKASTSRHSKNEMGMHQHGSHYKIAYCPRFNHGCCGYVD